VLDFGLHFGVVNAVSAARGHGDRDAARRAIATAFVVYASITAAAAAALLPALGRLPIHEAIGVGAQDEHLVRTVASLGFAALIFAMPFKVYGAGLTGDQEMWLVSLFRSAQAIVQLAALALAFAVFDAGLLGVAWVGLASELASWVAFAWWVEAHRPELGVRPRLASRALAPALLGTGASFVTMNLANLAKMSLGSAIVAHGRGPEEVATLSVPLGLFMIALNVAALVGSSLWPAYGEAAARSDWDWIGRSFALGTKVALAVAGGFAVLGAFFGADVIRLWAAKAGAPPLPLMVTLGAWLVAQVAINAAASLLNGMGRLRAVTIASVIEGIAVVAASLAAVRPWGALGVACAMACAGVANAACLLLIAIPVVTGGRVASPAALLGRLAIGLVGASALAGSLHVALAGSPPLVRLVAGAAPTAAAFAALVWLTLFDSTERLRLRAVWSRRRPA
jgi:O-antigen/teichoic acid export membrane protein